MRATLTCLLFIFSVLIPALAGPKAADIELKTHVVKKVRSKYGDDLQVISFQHKKSQLLLCVRQGLLVSIAVIPPKEQKLKSLSINAILVNGTKTYQGLVDHVIPVTLITKSPTFDQDNISTTGIFNVCFDVSTYNLKIGSEAPTKIITEFFCYPMNKENNTSGVFEIVIQNNEVSVDVSKEQGAAE